MAARPPRLAGHDGRVPGEEQEERQRGDQPQDHDAGQDPADQEAREMPWGIRSSYARRRAAAAGRGNSAAGPAAGPGQGACACLRRPRPGGEDALGARVHRVAHAVAEQVEGDRRDDQRQRREDQVPPGLLVVGLGASARMLPQLAAGGCTPRPRKSSVASNTIAAGMFSVASTSTGASRLGRMSMNMIRHGPEPERPGRLDVLLLLQRQRLAADHPGDAGPGEERDDPDDDRAGSGRTPTASDRASTM